MSPIGTAQLPRDRRHHGSDTRTQPPDALSSSLVGQAKLLGDLALRQPVRQLRENLRILLAK